MNLNSSIQRIKKELKAFFVASLGFTIVCIIAVAIVGAAVGIGLALMRYPLGSFSILMAIVAFLVFIALWRRARLLEGLIKER